MTTTPATPSLSERRGDGTDREEIHTMTEKPVAWRKAPPDLVDRFAAAVAGLEGLEPRPMFGYPAAFVGGNMVTGLHRESWIVRLGEADRTSLAEQGWQTFSPMPGRPMREYLALPSAVAADAEAARSWVERAAAYGRSLPPKPPRKRR
jgi:TfoX/Sxy family transcriptional regulator of competence genes